MAVIYQITPLVSQHTYQVTLTFSPQSTHQQLSLPVWIPGSYMLREFSKNISQLTATQAGQLCNCQQISKNQWQLEQLQPAQLVTVTYQVYAYEYGIRTAFLDHLRGYFNPTSLCLCVNGQEQQAHQVELADLPATWQVACGLPSIAGVNFTALDYDELLDCPFELGCFERYTIALNGVEHHLILSGTIPQFDSQRLLADIEQICTYQINLFGGQAPYSSYTFILNLSGEVYTGLEHRNSTLLMAPYTSLPTKAAVNREAYLKLLGLISHEFFHTWNVKRIKPQAFLPYDLNQENYTKLLWWFEGVTSYYDDLVLYRTGLISQAEYLQLVINNINNVYKYPGVKLQTLANSSLTSWIKYYRQDENSPNSMVSYYVKGALVALCLDLLIRAQSKFSLDDVLRYLYQRWQQTATGVGENEISAIIAAVTGVDVAEFITVATETCQDLPFTQLFAQFGLTLTERPASSFADSGKLNPVMTNDSQRRLDLGAKLDKQPLGYLVKNVYSGGPAAAVGLAGGDLLLAINQIKLTNLEQQLLFFTTDNPVEVTLFRQDRLLNLSLRLAPAIPQISELTVERPQQLANWL